MFRLESHPIFSYHCRVDSPTRSRLVPPHTPPIFYYQPNSLPVLQSGPSTMTTTPTEAEIEAFNQEMQSEWGLTTTQFRIVRGPSNRYNCIASAVEANGVATRKLTPPNMNILDAQCKAEVGLRLSE